MKTEELENKIREASPKEFEEILENLPKPSLKDKVDELCKQHGVKLSKVEAGADISRAMFYKILNGTQKSKKEQIIRIGVAIGAEIEELNELLKMAGHKELYVKNKDDAIILYGLKNKMTIYDIEALLIENNAMLHLIDED